MLVPTDVDVVVGTLLVVEELLPDDVDVLHPEEVLWPDDVDVLHPAEVLWPVDVELFHPDELLTAPALATVAAEAETESVPIDNMIVKTIRSETILRITNHSLQNANIEVATVIMIFSIQNNEIKTGPQIEGLLD